MESTDIDELIINSHEDGSQPASLNDPAVRLAIAYAIDKQQIVNVAYLGYAEPASVDHPHLAWATGTTAMCRTSPSTRPRATASWRRPAIVDSDGDGIREDADGNPLEYRLYATDDATKVRILEIISDGLAQIGISAPPPPWTRTA